MIKLNKTEKNIINITTNGMSKNIVDHIFVLINKWKSSPNVGGTSLISKRMINKVANDNKLSSKIEASPDGMSILKPIPYIGIPEIYLRMDGVYIYDISNQLNKNETRTPEKKITDWIYIKLTNLIQEKRTDIQIAEVMYEYINPDIDKTMWINNYISTLSDIRGINTKVPIKEKKLKEEFPIITNNKLDDSGKLEDNSNTNEHTNGDIEVQEVHPIINNQKPPSGGKRK